MSNGIMSPFLVRPPVKHKVFISYHHGGDQPYYDAFSETFDDQYDAITDNSLERKIDRDDTKYVIRRIRENFITGSSCTIVLVGADTPKRKYIDWEVKATLDKQHGLIGVQLPTITVNQNNTVNIPPRLNDNIKSGYVRWLTWSQITTSADYLEQFIATAKAASADLIDNTREQMSRNL